MSSVFVSAAATRLSSKLIPLCSALHVPRRSGGPAMRCMLHTLLRSHMHNYGFICVQVLFGGLLYVLTKLHNSIIETSAALFSVLIALSEKTT
ncbi:unnamed protein product, partial [Ceratitis capitata]